MLLECEKLIGFLPLGASKYQGERRRKLWDNLHNKELNIFWLSLSHGILLNNNKILLIEVWDITKQD